MVNTLRVEILDCYYQVKTKESLLIAMEDLIVNKRDTLQRRRAQVLELVRKGQESCSLRIIDDIKSATGERW